MNARPALSRCATPVGSGRGQRGQALAEFLTIALALIPLFLLIPVIAKYQDISHATQAASRYAAFDAIASNDSTSGWKDASQLGEEVRRRFFSNLTAPIKTNDVAGNFKAHQNLYWRTPDDRPLIENLQRDVQVRFGPSDATARDAGFRRASDAAVFQPVAPQLGLGARGIYTAQVSVTLAKMPSGLRFYQPLDTLDLRVKRGTGVVLNPWTAAGPAEVEERIAASPAVFPAGALAGVASSADGVVRAVDVLGGERAPLMGQLGFWRDVVPSDRLRGRAP